MLRKRLIPVILMKNGIIVQSRGFKRFQALGSPTAAVERLSNWDSDELIYLDISNKPKYDLNRDDLNHPQYSSILDIIKYVSEKCLMPLTFGGGIRSIEDAIIRVRLGSDKITLNTMAIEQPSFIRKCANILGSQCIVVSIDVKKNENGYWYVWKRDKDSVMLDPVEFARLVEREGAGEILLNSVDRDGSGNGFDLEIIEKVADAVRIPVIALGGAGKWEDFAEVLAKTKVSAVAAANIFHHSENSVYNAKKYLFERGFPVRRPLELSEYSNNL